MKKYIVSLFILGSFFCGASSVFATSGACSWHGGVDCSAGADAYGHAICEDGTSSSVSYSAMAECDQVVGACGIPLGYSCPTSQSTIDSFIASANGLMSQYKNLKASAQGSCAVLNARNGMLGGAGSCSVTQFDSDIDLCQSMINYEQTCSTLLSKSIQSDRDTECRSHLGSNAKSDPTTSVCVCTSGYMFNTGRTACVVPPTCDANVSFLGEKGSCVCRYGMTSAGDCQTRLGKCQADIGEHNACKLTSSGDPVVGCEEGYKLTIFGKCAIDASVNTATQAVSVAQITPITQTTSATPTPTQIKREVPQASLPSAPMQVSIPIQPATEVPVAPTSSVRRHWYDYFNPLFWLF